MDEQGATIEQTDLAQAPPGWTRRRRLGALALVALGFLAGSVTSGAGAVWASHQFSDVPPSNQFHDDIDWLLSNGITTGYLDGTFKPTAPVSRQAMAAFLHRLSDRTTLHVQSSDPAEASTFYQEVVCPNGSRPIAGGGETDITGLALTDSAPLSTGTPGWYARWETTEIGTVDPAEIKAWVSCVPG